jgi:hypothetical protein
VTTPQKKPWDLGNGQVCASFGTDGSWLSMGTAHPRAGLVELSGAPAFPAERDGQVDLVRAHRAHLTDPAIAMLHVADARVEAVGRDDEWRLRGAGWSARVQARSEGTDPTIVQRYLVTADGPAALRIEFGGRLDRPAYAEITPGGPIPPSLPPQTVEAVGATLRVRTSGGDAGPAARITVTSPELSVGAWAAADDGFVLEVSWADPAADVPLLVAVTMTGGGASSPRPRGPGFTVTAPAELASSGLAGIEAAAVRYTLGCTALEVAEDECCILTDHRLLPLSWTRDAYYQAAMMLSAGNGNMWPHRLVEEHLAWLWGPGRDPDGVWQRSHFANGAVKDPAYQADQQLYPLLELADYRRVTGSWPRLPDPFDTEAAYDPTTGWGQMVRDVWQSLPRGVGGMIPGDENPADDSATFPYLLSSQLLLCHTARRMAQYEHELGVQDLALGEDARATLAFTRSAFACDGPFGPQWAYECDGGDGRRLYHDANDVPTAVAPLWGLCSADDPLWRTTMRFAWSAHNPGYVAGLHGGLGSAHTAGVWPLGDAQEWIVARTIGDQDAEARLLAKFELVASDDGMLPETYDPDTGAWMARHWFAWPGSLVGLLHHTVDRGTGPWTADRGDGLPIPGYSPAESVDGRAVC